jgi:hypothetical protein
MKLVVSAGPSSRCLHPLSPLGKHGCLSLRWGEYHTSVRSPLGLEPDYPKPMEVYN